MIKPDVMDGIPKEPGIYLYTSTSSTVPWRAMKIEYKDDKLVGWSSHGWEGPYWQNEFDNYTWSERIEEPDM